MKKALIVLTLMISGIINAQQTYESIDISGQNRNYYQYLPTGFNAATEELPLVIVLHGLGGNALQMTTIGFNYIADTARFIPVYLQGLPNAYDQNSWNNGTFLSSTANDVLFISKVMDEMILNYNVNVSRVYMTGISMGSIMTYKAMRHLDDRIAAVSCHIGTMSTQEITGYNPINKIPVQHIHGTNDGTVPYDSGALPSLSLVPQTITKLKTVNGWTGDSTIVPIPDNVADGITIDKIVYDCTTPLELWRMNNADHIYLLPFVNDTGALFVTWHWFRQFSHPTPSTLSTENINIEINNIVMYPNPANSEIFLKGFYLIEKITIFDLNGKLVFQSNVNDERISFGNELSAGIYQVQFILKDGATTTQKLIIEQY